MSNPQLTTAACGRASASRVSLLEVEEPWCPALNSVQRTPAPQCAARASSSAVSASPVSRKAKSPSEKRREEGPPTGSGKSFPRKRTFGTETDRRQGRRSQKPTNENPVVSEERGPKTEECRIPKRTKDGAGNGPALSAEGNRAGGGREEGGCGRRGADGCLPPRAAADKSGSAERKAGSRKTRYLHKRDAAGKRMSATDERADAFRGQFRYADRRRRTVRQFGKSPKRRPDRRKQSGGSQAASVRKASKLQRSDTGRTRRTTASGRSSKRYERT